MTEAVDDVIRLAALLLTVLTGFSGLVYEVTWQRYLATLLGSASEATAAVLGLFLGGLALGYSLFGEATRRLVRRARAAGRAPRLLRFYGLLEAGIGVYALLFPTLFAGVLALSTALPRLPGALGFALDVGLSALLVLPPAVLMGGTIPILTQALPRSLADATRFHALVYACNTAGAFAGALAAGFWLIPAWGLVGVLQAMAATNLLAGGGFLLLDRWTAVPGLVERGTDTRRRIWDFAGAALLVGFAMMTLQTLLIRLGGLAFGSSQFTFSMVVAVFVLCIALGSLAVSALPRIPAFVLAVDLWVMVVALCLLYAVLEDSPYGAHVLRALFATQPAGFYAYHVAAFVAVLCIVGPPVLLAGATLPLIFDHLRREFGELGDVAGRLYSWSTLGSLLGALLGGYTLLYWMNLDAVFRVALIALVGAALLVSLRTLEIHRALVALLGAASLGAIAALPDWDPERLSAGLFRVRFAEAHTFDGADAFFSSRRRTQLLFYTDDPNSSVSVAEARHDGAFHRLVATNGKSDGLVPDEYLTMGLASLLPALLAERAERAFVIGYGTGVTAGEFAALDSAKEVIVSEISSGVIEAAPLFDFANQDASRNPKLRIQQGDAYRTLLRSEGRFDVIASEPSNPWVTGVEMLFTVEFLTAARDRLTPGGVYAQWFHTYETDPETVAMVLRTYAAVFDHVAVWYAMGKDLLLLGLQGPDQALDVARLAARMRRSDFAAAFRRCGIPDLPSLLAHELLPLGVVHAATPSGDLHTLLRPRLSHLAARAFFAAVGGELPPSVALEPARLGARNSLLRRFAASRGGRLPEPVRERVVSETCEYRPLECITLLAQWTHEAPVSRRRDALLAHIRNSPALSRTTELRLVKRLVHLYGGGRMPRERDLVETAVVASRYFVDYYHHAAPFDRRTLGQLWQMCQRDRQLKPRCDAARADAETDLGDLSTPLFGQEPRSGHRALDARRDWGKLSARASGRTASLGGSAIRGGAAIRGGLGIR